MWSLRSNTGKIIPIQQDTITTVGRRNAIIILDNDNSISKLHAKITVLKSDNESFKDELVCTIMDAGSKYGSFIMEKNNQLRRISAEGYRCAPMDRVRFGLQHHEFTLLYTPPYKYFSLVSRIYNEEREELSRILEMVNGVLCDDWNPQCTHVTCSTVKLTEKVACALVAGLYIVTKEYWYALAEALEDRKHRPLPSAAAFIPKVDSSILVTDQMSLLPNPVRRLLFNGKIFIFFLEDQLQVFSRMIELAGGKPLMYDETWKPQDCCQSNIIVMQSSDFNQSSQSSNYQYRSVCLRLSQDKLRNIPESEIPLAILYCSTEQYCNPRFCYDALLQPSKKTVIKETPGDILALDTQDPGFKYPKESQRNRIIPESVPFDSQMSSQRQPQLKIRNQTAINLNKSKIDKQNIIIPETMSIDTHISSKMQSQMSLKTQNANTSVTNLPTIKKQKVIPETPSEETQISTRMRSQVSSQIASQSSAVSPKRPSNNSMNNVGKPRITEVETVISPLFPKRSVRNAKIFDENRLKATEPALSDDQMSYDEDDSDFEIPKKSQQHRGIKSSKTTTKKRSKEVISPLHPNNDQKSNKEALAKKRKLNPEGGNDVIQSIDDGTIQPLSRKNNCIGRNKTVASSHDGSAEIDGEVGRAPHYFSRNSLDRPKCVIPQRLTMDDMYEWKPNRQL